MSIGNIIRRLGHDPDAPPTPHTSLDILPNTRQFNYKFENGSANHRVLTVNLLERYRKNNPVDIALTDGYSDFNESDRAFYAYDYGNDGYIRIVHNPNYARQDKPSIVLDCNSWNRAALNWLYGLEYDTRGYTPKLNQILSFDPTPFIRGEEPALRPVVPTEPSWYDAYIGTVTTETEEG